MSSCCASVESRDGERRLVFSKQHALTISTWLHSRCRCLKEGFVVWIRSCSGTNMEEWILQLLGHSCSRMGVVGDGERDDDDPSGAVLVPD